MHSNAAYQAFGGQVSAVCAVCALQYLVYPSYQPSCLWRGVSVDAIKGMIFKYVYHEISRPHYDKIGWSGILVNETHCRTVFL